MPDLKKTRNRLKIAIAALVLVDAAAIVMLVTPLAGMQQKRQQDLTQLWQDIKAREFAPWRGLDKKIPVARQQIDDFYRYRFPAQDSDISTDLGKVASQTGVSLSAIKYQQKDSSVGGLELVQIDAQLSGDYLQLVRFINALERDKVFFIVDGIQLAGEQSGTVRLQIKLETYLRTT